MECVIEIPHVPVVRIDHQDAVYKTYKEKLEAIVNELMESIKRHWYWVLSLMH